MTTLARYKRLQAMYYMIRLLFDLMCLCAHTCTNTHIHACDMHAHMNVRTYHSLITEFLIFNLIIDPKAWLSFVVVSAHKQTHPHKRVPLLATHTMGRRTHKSPRTIILKHRALT